MLSNFKPCWLTFVVLPDAWAASGLAVFDLTSVLFVCPNSLSLIFVSFLSAFASDGQEDDRKCPHLDSEESDASFREMSNGDELKSPHKSDGPEQEMSSLDCNGASAELLASPDGSKSKAEPEKRFGCDICGQAFRTKSYLNKHQHRVHKAQRPHGLSGSGLSDMASALTSPFSLQQNMSLLESFGFQIVQSAFASSLVDADAGQSGIDFGGKWLQPFRTQKMVYLEITLPQDSFFLNLMSNTFVKNGHIESYFFLVFQSVKKGYLDCTFFLWHEDISCNGYLFKVCCLALFLWPLWDEASFSRSSQVPRLFFCCYTFVSSFLLADCYSFTTFWTSDISLCWSLRKRLVFVRSGKALIQKVSISGHWVALVTVGDLDICFWQCWYWEALLFKKKPFQLYFFGIYKFSQKKQEMKREKLLLVVLQTRHFDKTFVLKCSVFLLFLFLSCWSICLFQVL